MNEFLKRLAQAIGLPDSATEDQVIAKVAQLAAGTPDVKELAQRSGLVALPAEQVAALTQQAQAGADALSQVKTLTQELRDNQFESLMASSGAAPALRDTYKELWDQGQHDQVRKILSATKPQVRMSPTGRAVTLPASGTDSALTLVQGTPLDRVGSYQIDDERLELHQKVESLAAARGLGYEQALDQLVNAGEAG